MNPCCIRVGKFGDRWSAATLQAPGEPIDPVELVVQAPEFLGLLVPDKPMPRAAMIVPQSTSGRVLIAVNETGGIELVGCPNPRVEGATGAVVSDLLAAKGRLWHQKPPVVAGPFRESLGTALPDWVGAKVGRGWSAQAFQAGLENCLAQGEFPIIIVVPALDDAAREMLSYLENMNLDVRPLGYDLYRGDGVEVVRPRWLVEEHPASKAPAAEPEAKKAVAPEPMKPGRTEAQNAEPARPEPAPGSSFKAETYPRPYREELAPAAPASRGPGRESGGRDAEPFPAVDTSQKQEEILARLHGLDGLGLKRKGFEYFVPARADQKEAAEGTIVIAVDPDRWPFPKDDEVIVVVNTGPNHMAALLKIPPREVEEFLGSLPRVERKEHKGCLLLRASNTHEATQLVNELRALKAVSSGGIG